MVWCTRRYVLTASIKLNLFGRQLSVQTLVQPITDPCMGAGMILV
jgi:hypothetical protein